jgi:hypothetical protein
MIDQNNQDFYKSDGAKNVSAFEPESPGAGLEHLHGIQR